MDDSTGGEVKLPLLIMEEKGPKTVFSNQDSAGNVTVYAVQTKRVAENTTIRRTLPGKSNISRIILHDNTSQERLLDLKIGEIKSSQRKRDAFMLHQKKTFLKRMEKKQSNWVREHNRQAVEFNNQGSRRLDGMLEMMRADIERMGAGGGTPTDGEGAGVVEDEDDEEKKLPVVSEKEYSAAMSMARIPERKLRHRSTGIPSLPTLLSLPSHIEQKGAHNPFLTSDHEDNAPEHLAQLKKSNTSASFSRQSKRNLGVANRKVSTVSIRSHTSPRETSNTLSLPIVTQSAARPITEPVANLFPSYRKKTKCHPSLPGPEPTFISETLPKINTSDPNVVRLHHQHQNRKAKQARRRARAREKNKATTSSSEDPLADDRFKNLQKFLSPKLASDHQTRDIAALVQGIAAAKRLGRKHFGMAANDVISDEDGQDQS